MALTGTFNPAQGILTFMADSLANTLVVSRNAGGQILGNGGAIAINGGTPTVANTALIQIFGGAGADVITFNEASGALPRGYLFGDAGDDVLTGGSGNDLLSGGDDDDTLLGKGGMDLLLGGAGNDTLTGGDANDQVYGEDGDDRLIWNPGDDSDIFEGGAGTDTAQINGGNGTEQFVVSTSGDRIFADRVNPAPFQLDTGTCEILVINANGGDDSISVSGSLAGLIRIVMDGGTGLDTLVGGDGDDVLIGGDGADSLDGAAGNDTFVLNGEGNFANTLADASGFDTVTTTITRSISPWAFIEGLTLTEGAGGIWGFGNALSNGLIGNNSNNRLEGLDGNDIFAGLRGCDTLVGGNNDDTFRFLSTADSLAGALRDVITDFDDLGDDIIDLSPIPGVTTFIGSAAFTAAGQVRAIQSGAHVLVQINTTGIGGAESEILLLDTTLGGGVGQVDAADFLL